MYQDVPVPDRFMAQFKVGSGDSEDVKYSKQDLVWKRVDRRHLAGAPLTPAYP